MGHSQRVTTMLIIIIIIITTVITGTFIVIVGFGSSGEREPLVFAMRSCVNNYPLFFVFIRLFQICFAAIVLKQASLKMLLGRNAHKRERDSKCIPYYKIASCLNEHAKLINI